MKYEVRVQGRQAPDLIIDDVDESQIGKVVTAWCSSRNVCIVKTKEGVVNDVDD